MPQSFRPLFREQALKHYMQRQEKDVLLRFVTPPFILCLWILLCLSLLATWLAWWTEVPIYVEGSGLVVMQPATSIASHPSAQILVFLPATAISHIYVGSSVLLQVGSTGPRFSTAVTYVDPAIVSPATLHLRYAIFERLSQPVIVLTLRPVPALARQAYAGSQLRAQVQNCCLSDLTGLWPAGAAAYQSGG